MTTRDVLLQAEAISARCREASGVAQSCGNTLHVGFFFDGFARHLEEDLLENRVSNIGKLFLAHQVDGADTPTNTFQRYRKFYVSGLAADYDASLGAQAGGTLSREKTGADEHICTELMHLAGRRVWFRHTAVIDDWALPSGIPVRIS